MHLLEFLELLERNFWEKIHQFQNFVALYQCLVGLACDPVILFSTIYDLVCDGAFCFVVSGSGLNNFRWPDMQPPPPLVEATVMQICVWVGG